MIAWVEQRYVASTRQIAEQADKFRDYHQSRGSLMASWDAAWRTWWQNDFHKIGKRAVAVAPLFDNLPKAEDQAIWDEFALAAEFDRKGYR
jgi:hypothetical protein